MTDTVGKKGASSQSHPSDLGANVDILSNHLHCLDWEVSRCEAQHLGFEPVTCLPVSWGISVDRRGPKLFISCFGLQQTLCKLHNTATATCVSGDTINKTENSDFFQDTTRCVKSHFSANLKLTAPLFVFPFYCPANKAGLSRRLITG